MRARTGPSLLVLVAAVLAVAAACSSGGDRQPTPTPASQGQAAGQHQGHPAPAQAAPGRPPAPQDLRAGFEQLLGRHTLLTARLMRSEVFGAPDVKQATQASVERNTGELRQLVAAAYNAQEGERFEGRWDPIVTHLGEYAVAVGKRAPADRQAAAGALAADSRAYGAWLDTASQGRVNPAEAERAVKAHIDALTRQADAYAARDYDEAYRLEREAFRQMFGSGVLMARGSLTPADAAVLDSAPAKLRSAFAMLLGEHMQLIIDAQRAAFTGKAEFDAAAAQVNANSQAIVEAMGAIVGPARAAEFEANWGHHVERLMAYSGAVAGRDRKGQAQAEQELAKYARGLAGYFNDVVQDRLKLGSLLGVLTLHDRHLTDHVDAFAARDFATATRLEEEGYKHMHGVADTLVGAIQKTVQSGMPVGGAQTGGGGTRTGGEG
jgi:hypothetical protein